MQKTIIVIALATLTIVGCTKSETKDSSQENIPAAATTSGGDVGIGPVHVVNIEKDLNAQWTTKGSELFTAKCAACHKMDERYVGPALKGVTERRKPEWIMNMILNPQEMTQKDPTAQELLGEYMTQMTFQNVSQDEARAILEYFRSIDKK